MALARRQELAHLYLLLWLKARLMWRLYTGNTSALVGVIIALVIFVPFSLGIAVGCFFGFRLLAPPMNEHLLRGVLLLTYLLWLLSPVMGFALTEDYDIAGLLCYPVSPRTIFAGTVLSSVVDLGVIFIAPTMLATVIGFTTGVDSFLATTLALGLFLFHSIGLSQAGRLALWGVVRSRRGRDVLMILAGLTLFGFAAAMQILPRRLTFVNWSGFLNGWFWNALSYLPPGLAARAIGAVARGRYLEGLIFVAALSVLAIATIYAAGWLVHRIYTGEVVTGRVGRPQAESPERRAEAGAPPRALSLRLPLHLPAVVEAVASKDAKYLLRDPYFKFSLMGVLYMVLIFVAMFLWGHGRELTGTPHVTHWTLWISSSVLLMMEAGMVFNQFGLEGPAVSLLFLFPGGRKQVLIGKNLPVLVALVVINSTLMLIFCAIVKELHLYPLVVLWTALAGVVFTGVGNLASIWAPMRIVMRGWRPQVQSSGRSFFQGLISLAMTSFAGLLSLPILAGLALPVHFLSPWWLVFTAPLMIAYTAVCYLVFLHLAERELARRDVEIIEKLTEPD